MSELYIAPNPPNALSNIIPIELSYGQLARTIADLDRIVEPPALPACQDLYNKNIKTVSASANRKDSEGAYIIVDFASLSDENKATALKLGEPVAPIRHDVSSDSSDPEAVKLFVPLDVDDTPATVSEKLKSIAEPFVAQRLLWAPSYTIDELKAIYSYKQDEDVPIEDFVAEGFYFDPENERFHLSEELYLKKPGSS